MRFIAPRESLGSCFSYALTLRTSVPSQGNAWRSILSGTVGGCEVCIFASFPTFTTELFLVWYAKCYSWKLSIDKIYRSGQHQRKIDTSLNRPLKGRTLMTDTIGKSTMPDMYLMYRRGYVSDRLKYEFCQTVAL